MARRKNSLPRSLTLNMATFMSIRSIPILTPQNNPCSQILHIPTYLSNQLKLPQLAYIRCQNESNLRVTLSIVRVRENKNYSHPFEEFYNSQDIF